MSCLLVVSLSFWSMVGVDIGRCFRASRVDRPPFTRSLLLCPISPRARASADHNTARLWSETDKLVLGFGTSAYSRYSDVSDSANAEGWGTLHLLKPHTIFFEGFSTRSIAGNGIGVECACEGADELYNFVKIRQVERISNQTAEVREFTYPLSNGPSMTGGLWQAREFNQVARGEQWISFPPARLHKQVGLRCGGVAFEMPTLAPSITRLRPIHSITLTCLPWTLFPPPPPPSAALSLE